MWLIALKGLTGSGKSTLGLAISKQLGWPLIDKGDVKDILDGYTPETCGLAYDIMFNIAHRQLLQGLNVIYDSPLLSKMSYQRARNIVADASASLAIVECRCSDSGRSNVQFKSYPGMSHLFMPFKGGEKSTPAAYNVPGHVVEEVIKDITEWVKRVI